MPNTASTYRREYAYGSVAYDTCSQIFRIVPNPHLAVPKWVEPTITAMDISTTVPDHCTDLCAYIEYPYTDASLLCIQILPWIGTRAVRSSYFAMFETFDIFYTHMDQAANSRWYNEGENAITEWQKRRENAKIVHALSELARGVEQDDIREAQLKRHRRMPAYTPELPDRVE
jgi:hypothetical protein